MSLNQIDISIKNPSKPRIESSTTEQNTSTKPLADSCKMPMPVLMRFFKPAKGEKKFWKAKRNISSNVQTLLKRKQKQISDFLKMLLKIMTDFFLFRYFAMSSKFQVEPPLFASCVAAP